MSIVSRFSDIMKSNINALLDKCEDPAKMVDQTLRDLRENLAQVKQETAGIMADAKKADRDVASCKAEVERYTAAAQAAIKAGNDEDAKKLIATKQKYDEQLAMLQKNADLANANADKMRQMHDKLVNDINALEIRKDTIKATAATAKTQEKINKMQDGGKKAASSIEAFDRMEAKANKALDAAMAHADLNSQKDSASDLADKYTGAGGSTSVDDELAAMKASMGL